MKRLFRESRFNYFLFAVFCITIAAVLLGPIIFVDRKWLGEVNWPVSDTNGTFWVPTFLISHALLALGVTINGFRHSERKIVLIWLAQVVAISAFSLALFGFRSLPVAAAMELTVAVLALTQLMVSKNKLYNAMFYLPVCVFYVLAAKVILEAIVS